MWICSLSWAVQHGYRGSGITKEESGRRKERRAVSERVGFVIVAEERWRRVKRLNFVIRKGSTVFQIWNCVYTKAEEGDLRLTKMHRNTHGHTSAYIRTKYDTTSYWGPARKWAWVSEWVWKMESKQEIKRQSVRGGVVWREVGVWKTNLPKSVWEELCAKLSLTEIL